MNYLLIVFEADKPKNDENYRWWRVEESLFERIKDSRIISLEKVDYEIVETRFTKQILIIDVRVK